MSWRVFVLPHLTNDLILGQDFLSFYGAQLDCRSHSISWSRPNRAPVASHDCYVPLLHCKNRFSCLENESYSPPFLSPAKIEREKRAKKRPSQISMAPLAHALKNSSVKVHNNPVDTPSHAYLSIEHSQDREPMLSVRRKVFLRHSDGSFITLSPGKRSAFINNTCPLVTVRNDLLLLQGLVSVYTDKLGRAYTYAQITNVSIEFLPLHHMDFIGSVEFVQQGTSFHDLSLLSALSPPSPPDSISEEKRQYL